MASKRTSAELIKWKIGIVGQTGVGKTSVLLRFVENSFSADSTLSVGDDYKQKSVKVKEKLLVTLQMWDTAGQERFKAMTSSYYRGALGVIIVYDVSNAVSFQKVPEWLGSIRHSIKGPMPMILIGNKCDVSDAEREVSLDVAIEFAKSEGIKHVIETSAKTALNIDEAFQILATEIADVVFPNLDENGLNRSTEFNNNNNNSNRVRVDLQRKSGNGGRKFCIV